jgi:N-methylhydantoinase A
VSARAAVDIGGTFTDLVALDEGSGEVSTAKVQTTPPSFERGVMQTLTSAKLDPAAVEFFVHGSTVIINALTERRGARTGLITTKGFRDVLEIQRANRPDLYNLYYSKPRPFVARHLRLEVTERVSHKGEVVTPLAEAEVAEAIVQLRDEGVEAVAICFLHSYANPAHERRAAEIVRGEWPEAFVTASCEISMEWREYERTSTAVLNSYVRPVADRYLASLGYDLDDAGVRGGRYVMQSSGGAATFAAARSAPITMVESGPVAGVLGAVAFGELIGERNIVSLDIGGTTAKCSLVDDGEVRVTTDYKLEWTRAFAGYPVKVPVVDIVEIGAGGGSIAWLDEAGAMNVGPQSAGAVPGPACYGRGGEDPTLTDANLIAGRINSDYFLGGEVRLEPERARRALGPLAGHFGTDEQRAAVGVIRLANGNMVNALKLVSVQRGYDPREFALVAFGGAGPMHATALARELQIGRVVVPPEPGVFSAWGMLMSDLRFDLIVTRIQRADAAAPAALDELWGELERQALAHYARERVGEERVVFQRFVDMRYAGQEHTVKVPFPAGRVTEEKLAELQESFHALHEQRYSFRLPTPSELVNLHLTALAAVQKPRLPELAPGEAVEGARKGERYVDFDEAGRLGAAIYERGLLGPGARVVGPAVVEEPACTTLLFPGDALEVDRYGTLIIEVGRDG